MTIHFRHATVGDTQVFYREAGSTSDPHVLLLHGFPTSSHMFRNLIPLLAQRYHVIAPDLPGFGFTRLPESKGPATFQQMAEIIERFTQTLQLEQYVLYVFDYGAPVGFRLAVAQPQRVLAIISQNGNAYLEGLSEGWNPIQAYWKNPTEANRNALRGFLSLETTQAQYEHGVADTSLLAPETYTLDASLMSRPGNDVLQLDLFLDYSSNVELYPAFQSYFREHQPPLLAVWGKNDPFFVPAGA